MATVNYTISNGTPPYTVELLYQGTETVVDTNTHGSVGTYFFTNVLDDDYTVRVTDTNSCIDTFDVTVDCITTTTTTTSTTTTTTTTITTTTTTTSTTTTTTTTLAITRRLKYHNGSDWIAKPIKVYEGGQWVEKELKETWV